MDKKITIIVCTYNRCEILQECLDALTAQNVSHAKFDVIIVDNNSSDGTSKIVNDYLKRFSSFKYIKEVNQGLSHARNRGAKEATTEWIAYLDDDGKAHVDFIEQALHVINNYDFDCFGGIYGPWYKYGRPKWLSESFGMKNPLADEIISIDTVSLDGGILAIKKKCLEEVDYFPTELGMTGDKIAYGEETAMQERLLEKGFKLGFTPYWKMDHLVSRAKLSVWWHIKAEYAKGRDSMILGGITPTNWNQIDKIKFLLSCIFYGIFNNGRKIFRSDYYFQNLLLDTIKPICFRYGQQSLLN
jgi:glycosyltransferase involved in cell wall biosynthesis